MDDDRRGRAVTGAAIEVRLAPSGDPMSNADVVRSLAEQYLIWDTFVGGARRVDVHPLVLSSTLHGRAVETAENVVRVLTDRVGEMAFDDATERERYGFHRDTWKLVRASRGTNDAAAMVRVDLLLDRNDQWRVCEVNADCPGGYNESLALPRLARSEGGFTAANNPTHAVDALAARLAAIARSTGPDDAGVALLYATGYSEDLQVCALLQRTLKRLGVPAVLASPAKPRLRDGVLHVGPQPVSVLYRYFPTEYMQGLHNLDEIAEGITRKQVRTVSSFAQMFVQSKLVMARAWARRDELDPWERAQIEAHIPETFDVADVPVQDLLRNRAAWVVKRTLGRVGDDVFVGSIMDDDDWRGINELVSTLRATGDRWIAQRYVDQQTVPTPWGPQFVTLGAYVLEGRFVGYYARVTPESHVSHDALCLPVFAERAA